MEEAESSTKSYVCWICNQEYKDAAKFLWHIRECAGEEKYSYVISPRLLIAAVVLFIPAVVLIASLSK